MHDSEPTPTTGDASIISLDMAADDAPALGMRVSVDYVARDEGRGIGVTWLAPDPDGAWAVSRVGRPDPQGRVTVVLEHAYRPSPPDEP